MTVNDIIEGILEREGKGVAPYLVAGDAGGRTSWGISERSHPEAWRPGPPSREMAIAIYVREYVAPFDAIPYTMLRVALVDDAVLSGVTTAIKRLQVVLGAKPDGVIGPKTLAAIQQWSPVPLVKAFVVERAIRVVRLVQKRPSDLPFLGGWMIRILGFLP